MSLALDHTHDGLPVIPADEGVGFPIPDPAPCLDNGRTTHRLVADAGVSADLLGTPLQREFLLGELPGRLINCPRVHQ
jgi:hypothetical protein